MKQSHQTARIANGLAPPQNGLSRSLAMILFIQSIFCHAMTFVGCADGEDKQEGEGGTWDESQELRFSQREDIVHLQTF